MQQFKLTKGVIVLEYIKCYDININNMWNLNQSDMK
jgi:hypothetical protein